MSVPSLRRLLPALLVLSLLAWGNARPAAAETLDEAYARALQDYYAGKYGEAVKVFERILAVPLQHEDLHYNLGCAYFRMGELGRAIYHFEKALTLDPEADDARFNLATARSLAAAKVKDELKKAAPPPLWQRLVTFWQPGTITVVFLVLFWLVCGLLLALRFVQPGALRAGLIAGTALLALLALLAGGTLFGAELYQRRVVQAIVLPDKLEVREGPNRSTKVTFSLHAGFKVRIQAREAGWARLRLNNGLEGWVPEKQLGVL